MKTGESKSGLLLFAFVVTLAAGASLGMLSSRLFSQPTDTSVPGRSPLANELNLTAEQAQQMQRIWESVRESAGSSLMRAKNMDLEREKAMEALLNSSQRAQYDKIKVDYNTRIEQLKADREAMFQKALRQTKALLTEPQRLKYEKLLHDRTGRDLPQGPETDFDGVNASPGQLHGSSATQP